MTVRRLVIRSLRHYWRTGVVVVFALAVATAVIVGSLIIGASVTGSIRRTALSRLGDIHYALTAPRYFRAELAHTLGDRAAALILLSGAARNPATDAVVPQVTAIGTDAAWWPLYEGASDPKLSGREAAINQSLANDLGLKTGDALLLTVSRDSDVPTDTLFAHRERERAAHTLRLTVKSVLPDAGVGSLRLDAQPGTPRNVFLDRDWLAGQLQRAGRINAIVAGAQEEGGAAEAASQSASRVPAALERAMNLDDYGLKLSPSDEGYISVHSERILLSDREVEAARAAAGDCGARADVTSVYLAETIQAAGDDRRRISYAIVAAVGRMSPVQIVDGRVRDIGDGLVLNRWAAKDLQAQVGERFRITYLVPSWERGYETATIELTLRGIIGTAGMGADPDLVPEFEGITDAEHVDDWNPPFPVDLDRITDRDEKYWDLYRAAPKAFVGLSTARAMWAGGPSGAGTGWITSVRVYPRRGETLAQLRPRLRQALLGHLRPEDAGLTLRPVRAIALEASKGTSDFSQLFLGMSMFLVLAGAGLAGMLMRLSADRRAAQAGIMLATGFTSYSAARVILLEGAALALPGAALGVPVGVMYGWGIIHALGSWWQGALGAGPS
ncbi:MAG: hypothetical protein J7M38_07810, partial [Armatimonadetes bacterium]|nr:hypothetical protein [Armatimonadota bacterium]